MLQIIPNVCPKRKINLSKLNYVRHRKKVCQYHLLVSFSVRFVNTKILVVEAGSLSNTGYEELLDNKLKASWLFAVDPDSNFSLQKACHKFVMTRVQACGKLTKAPKSP
ncbi:hypothetical protein AVEN_250852-1 [Araneus ventricosus]|uniref:Uncharacterized protein n=1 Tax=Araneus ventricosus TaxID=182803 RepID=A0A4Y2SDE7_ARAVE|nr:hypothetical protein AVEN_250852-1 [Araneus ventricosus]